tara:strand:+ start:760 stop:1395 length:636 start_codon:yes stop_codon:yes gene_type:complete
VKSSPSDPSLLRQAQYTLSAHLPRDWPEDRGSEVAFAGRSNVGKSSAINAITGHNRLARTSKTPGRTQQINFFTLDEDRRLVDLPGYGYAKVPVVMQQHWEKTIRRYLEERASLRALILPVDSRREPTELDWQLLSWCAANQLPVHVLLTKSDKQGRGKRTQALRLARESLVSMPLTSVQLFSATQGMGLEQARQRIMELLGSGAQAGPTT